MKISKREKVEIINEIKKLVDSKGYVYALCSIIFNDFYIVLETIHEIDHSKTLSTKEVSFLLGFLIQKKIDFTIPDTFEDVIQMKENTYKLMEELQWCLMKPFSDQLQKEVRKEHKSEDFNKRQKEFWSKGEMFVEPIFYSADGVYDFQYLDFLGKKYHYDIKWLNERKKIVIDNVRRILPKIKDILQLKHRKFEYSFKDENTINKFFSDLIETFVFRKTDFEVNSGLEAFCKNFSIEVEKGLNSQFEDIGNYNIINSHPIIKLDQERYFVPIPYLLFQAVYEGPFFWMLADPNYKDIALENRGKVGEEISFNIFLRIFERKNCYKSVKIISKKGKSETDIDILILLGSKSLCVQVKSKSLTLLSRQGDDLQLQKDFKGAVQDSYKQGLKSRQKILENGARFYDEHGNEILLSEEIEEVYLMCITMENYLAITHQTNVMLEKSEDEPFPIVLTIYDLELLVHYLNDPYDFMYYIKQRISLMDYFRANDEMSYLGYHLERKLWKIPKYNLCTIEGSFASIIDRNYYPMKIGAKVSDKGDVLKIRWKNDKFEQLCKELKSLEEPKITDVLFYLFDMSGNGRDSLVTSITSTRQKTLIDNKLHSVVLPPDPLYPSNAGFTYVSMPSDSEEELRLTAIGYSEVRKYKSKADLWIGLGSYRTSSNMVDAVILLEDPWKHNSELEKLLPMLNQGYHKIFNKVGRNKPCTCGSGFKYKNCCGKTKFQQF